jgi:hypothetical protein
MITRYSVLVASLGTLAGATAHAHPGHGEPGDDFSLLHYLTEPMHLGVGICLLIGSVAIAKLIMKSRSRSERHESTVEV